MTDAPERIMLISCVGVQDDLPLLPHFLAHYRDLGIREGAAHVIVHAPDPAHPGVAEARSVLAEFGHEPAEIWTDPYSSAAMWERRRVVQSGVASDCDWIINADVDELHEYPDQLSRVRDWCKARSFTCVQGPFIDRIAHDGRLARVSAAAPLEAQFPVKAEAMLRIAGTGVHDRYGTVKMMLHRGDVHPGRGGHHPRSGSGPVRYALHRPLAEFPAITHPAFRFAHPFKVHHYKWTDSLVTGLQRRIADPNVSPAGHDYGTRLLAYFEAHEGFDLQELARDKRKSPAGLPWRLRMTALRRQSQLRSMMGGVKRRLQAVSP